MRLLTVICVAALVVAFAVPAFAETQNIKVSGDIKAAYVYQRNIDFVNTGGDNPNFFMQQIGLNVEADLTDNVSTYIRLINERDWDGINSTNPEFDIMLDEAYITLKEMLYAPLTVKVGRQNIWLGKGFVMGNAGPGNWANGQLPGTIFEYSDMTAFDAIRATLDYDPWTVDLIYAKIQESNPALYQDDADLYIANVGYDFTKYDAEAEAYYMYAHDRDSKRLNPHNKSNRIHMVGLRGSLVPFENMNLWAEGAFQVGRDKVNYADARRQAGAVDVGLDYTFADVKWTPKVGAEWIWLSGDKDADKQKGWDPMFRGKYDNYIADFRGISKSTVIAGDTGLSNQQSIALFGEMSPMTDITLDAKWTFLWLDQKLVGVVGRNESSNKIGWELDGKVAYDYTEDVQFSVAAGYFKPGNSYETDFDKAATQIVAGVVVDF